jgi:hypothetical protein
MTTLAAIIATALAALATPSAPQAAADPADDDSPTDAEMFTQSSRFVEGINQLGISRSDIPTVPASERDTLVSFVQYVADNYVSPTTTSSAESTDVEATGCDEGGRFSHAYQTALSNSAQDGNARDIGSETVDMYLSHYVDMPDSQVGDTCDVNDESQYLSNWITNDDRNVYDSFLSESSALDLTAKTVTAIDAANSFKSAPENYRKAKKAVIEDGWGQLVWVVPTGVDTLAAGKEILTNFDDVIVDLQGNADPRAEVDAINSRLSYDGYTSAGIEWMIAIIAGALMPEPEGGPLLFDVGLATLDLYTVMATDVIPQGAVAAMQASLSGRVSTRLERYWGLI